MNSGRELAGVRVLEDVLANFAFLFGEARAAGDLPDLTGPASLACLPFRSTSADCIALAVPEGLALEIAANTLGAEPGDPEVALRARDAVMEVASVMGGHLAVALEASGPPVTLFPPQIFPLGREDWERLRMDPKTRCFAVGEHPLLLRLGPASEVKA
jgi:hypothetical protein